MAVLDDEPVTTETSVEQVLTGLQVGLTGARGTCSRCGRDLHDGHCVTVFAYRTAGHTEWNTARISCRDCGSDEIETPTLGMIDGYTLADETEIARVGQRWREIHRERLERIEDQTVSAIEDFYG